MSLSEDIGRCSRAALAGRVRYLIWGQLFEQSPERSCKVVRLVEVRESSTDDVLMNVERSR